MKWAKEQTTNQRVTYVQATRLIGRKSRITLAALRDLVAATEDYDERSQVTLEDTSVKVTETKQTGWHERGRAEGAGQPTNHESDHENVAGQG